MTRIALLLAGIAPFAVAVPAAAQTMDHSMHGAAPAAQPAPAEAPGCTPEHAAIGHCTPEAAPAADGDAHAGHGKGHGKGHGAGHAMDPAMDQAPAPSDPDCPPEHAAMGHCTPKQAPAHGEAREPAAPGASGTDLPPGDAPAPPPPGDWYADRLFPKEEMEHSRHEMMKENGAQMIAFISINLAEYQARKGHDGFRWDGEAWYGGDINRLTLKSEGEAAFGEGLESGEIQAVYSRAIGPYFNAQAGIRQDIGRGPDRTYATVGFEGLAPYWFEVEGALFLSTKGDLLARIEGSYDQRITQKLVLQPAAEINFALQDVPESGIGSGLSDVELGLRLRYEIVREFAPYVGVEWARKIGDTARFARAAGEDVGGVSVVMGIKTWF